MDAYFLGTRPESLRTDARSCVNPFLITCSAEHCCCCKGQELRSLRFGPLRFGAPSPKCLQIGWKWCDIHLSFYMRLSDVLIVDRDSHELLLNKYENEVLRTDKR